VKRSSEIAKALVSKIRVILVDDNELFRAGMKALISAKEEFAVVGEARDKAQALSIIEQEQPDVILLNAELKGDGGLEMISDLMSECETSRLAVLTGSGDPEIHQQAMSRGAIGVISKDDSPDLLMNAIKRVHAGGVWLDRFVTAEMLRNLSSGNKDQNTGREGADTASLTKREREVIRLVGEGLKNKQIAERLFISDVTVHHHLTSIYSKLRVKDRLELIVYAYRNRLAELPG